MSWKNDGIRCFSLLRLYCCFWRAAGRQRRMALSRRHLELPELKVTFFDVGKGDAILLETEEETMLIDTGYDDTADVILDYLEEKGSEPWTAW